MWYALAKASGDPRVRVTAMTALALSSASDPISCMIKIFELSDGLNDSDTLNDSLEPIDRVIAVMARDSNAAQFREAPQLEPVVSRLDGLRAALATNDARGPGAGAPGGRSEEPGAASAMASLDACVLDARDAGLDASTGPAEPSGCEQLLGRLEAAHMSLPPAARFDRTFGIA